MKSNALQIAEDRQAVKMTVLHREGHQWYQSEIGRLVNGLHTGASTHPKFPEHLVLFGHHTKEKTLEVLPGDQSYTAMLITGLHSEELPFVPGFV